MADIVSPSDAPRPGAQPQAEPHAAEPQQDKAQPAEPRHIEQQPDDLPQADQLLTLLAVAEAGNESAAAEQLGIGQSSVSRRLAGLQRATPTPLTRRSPAGTRLTPAGAALLPYAKDVRAALLAAARLLSPTESAALRVELGLSPHLVPRLAGELARAAHADEPLDLQYTEGSSTDLLAAVRAGALDAALTLWAPAGSEPGLRAERLGDDRVVLTAVAGSGVTSAGNVDLDRLRNSPLLAPTDGSLTGHAQAFARAAHLPPGSTVRLAGPAAVRSAALAGGGVGVTLASYVQAETAAAWLATAPLARALAAAAGADGVPPTKTPQPGDDLVGVWLLVSDALPAATADRLRAYVAEAVRRTEPPLARTNA